MFPIQIMEGNEVPYEATKGNLEGQPEIKAKSLMV